MTVLVVVLLLIAALDAVSLLGWTADSRDPDFSLGRVLRPRPSAARRSTDAIGAARPVISAGELRP